MLPNPYIEPFFFGPILMHPFGLLVGSGLVLGYFVVEKRLLTWGLRHELAIPLAAACFIGGAFGGHWFDLFFYNPQALVEQGWFAIINIPDGLASLGSFMGAFAVGLTYLRLKKQPFWPYVDACVIATTVAWFLGRMGCTVAYDHPGPITDSIFGMPYTGVEVAHGVRHNLGFYEAVFTLGLVVFYWRHWKRTHFVGWAAIMFGLTYMPFRFMLDFLRANDRTYFGLTPGQYVCVAAFVLCVVLYRRLQGSTHLLVSDGQPHRLPDGTTVPGVKTQVSEATAAP